MEVFLGLSTIAFLPVITSILFNWLQKKTRFGKWNYYLQQGIIGVIFGLLAVLGTEKGVPVGGAAANARDASVLIAGLMFGAPAGILSGLIGGIERYAAVAWGAGTFTRVACTTATILAGFIGATLRKYMFDNKKPPFLYALGIGVVTEVLHMLLIFVTHMDDIHTAFEFVEKCALPMITVNGIAVMLSSLIVQLLNKEKILHWRDDKQITVEFQKWLLLMTGIAFIVTGAFTFMIQISLAKDDIPSLLSQALTDVDADISEASDENLLDLTATVKSEYLSGQSISLIAQKHNISEINVIDADGIIIESTYPDFLNYDMASGEQSSAFLVLLGEEETYVQSYQPTSYDNTLWRKYAGRSLPDGGFIQVGYDAEDFQKDIASEIVRATQNRHIGRTGFTIVVDENYVVVGDKKVTVGDDLVENINFEEPFQATVNDEICYIMAGQTEGFTVFAVLPRSEAIFSQNFTLYVMSMLLIVIFVSLFIMIYFLIKKFVIDNINTVNDALAEITGGNLNVTVDVRGNEEFASLSDDINETVVTLKGYIEEAAARIDKELEFAKSIQLSALPSIFPKRKEFDLFASMETAKEVGGDFYDFYMLGDSILMFLIADVSGKGIGAAMFMMRAKTVIKGLAEAGLPVDEVFATANDNLCQGNDADLFVTAWLGMLDLKTGHLSFANAGHNPPVLRHENGETTYLRSKPDLVLGAMDEMPYHSEETTLVPGDILYLYTDGITEATDANDELYGEDRLINVISSEQDFTAQEICESVTADVAKFVGDAPQFDDMTMMCVEYKEKMN